MTPVPVPRLEKRRKSLLEFLNTGRNEPGKVVSARFPSDLPNKKLADIEKNAISAFCAPQNCLQDVHRRIRKRQDIDDESQETIIKNIWNWNNRKDYADGIVLSLYERSSPDKTKEFIGDPIADSLAVVTRANSSILALADGVSWGHKSRLASTCSIYASVTYLNEHLPSCKKTRDVFRHILKAFEKAHQCIVNEQGTMTTLCVGVVVPLPEKDRYGICVVNVGDSYAYVFSRENGVKEVTEASHPIDDARDMRHSGGALGPADGCNPDISNLTCSYVVVEKGDLVFLCSDGVSDNFDPNVARFTPNLPRKNDMIQLNSIADAKKDADNSKNIERGISEPFEQISVPDINLFSPVQLCSMCQLDEYNRIRNSPETLVEEKNKRNSPELLAVETNVARRGSRIMDFFPKLENYPAKTEKESTDGASTSESDSDDEGKFPRVPKCGKCRKPLKRGSEWSILYQEDRRNSVLDFMSPDNILKISTSKSMEDMKDETDAKEESSRGKSSSFTNDNEHSSEGVKLEKEAAFALLQRTSSHILYKSQPSVDERTGRKLKEETPFRKTLSPRDRREGALVKMNEIINEKILIDEGTSEDLNVGEICERVVNFVIKNTEEKRSILERVPQSELNQMTSKARKLHNEKIKKELEDVPGKLDHASIVCYQVGNHHEVEHGISLDHQKSIPNANLLPENKGNLAQTLDGKQFKQADIRNAVPIRMIQTSIL